MPLCIETSRLQLSVRLAGLVSDNANSTQQLAFANRYVDAELSNWSGVLWAA